MKIMTLHRSVDLIPALSERDVAVSAALRRLTSKYNFESGAVIVQIPQVPTALLETKTALGRGYFAYPPQALFYLSAAFEGIGIPTKLVDLNYTTLDAAQNGSDADSAWQSEIEVSLKTFPQPFVCVSFMFDPTWPQLIAVVGHIKKLRPDCAVAVGGVAATADPERVLRHAGADLVFSNEGERPLQEFYRFIREQSAVPDNISILGENGDVVHSKITTGGDIDLDIRPQYEKLPIARYHLIGSLNNFSRMRGTEIPFATVISRRGCRAKCTFCAVRNFNGRGVRVRATQGVVEEMAYLVEQHGIRHFDWLDDDLLYDHDSAVAMFESSAHRLPGITWAAHNGLFASAVTPALMDAMEKSGCIGFGVGLETGNKEMLKKIRKPARLDKFFQFAALSRLHPKMHYLVNFILGLPTETFSQMLDSFNVATKGALDWNNFFTFQPLKNTDAYLAYGGMDDGRQDEDVVTRGTTMNFNQVRGGNFKIANENGDIATGYEVYSLDPSFIPGQEQRKEIWFTFNYIANFLRMPALFSNEELRLRNGIRWLEALSQAYEENPAIDCVLYYLHGRLGAIAPQKLQEFRANAMKKFAASEYWRYRDQQFQFTGFLDNAVPAVDTRAIRWLGNAA